MQCPLCGKDVQTDQGMRKHLMGTRKYSGHELNIAAAETQVLLARGAVGTATRGAGIAPPPPMEEPRASTTIMGARMLLPVAVSVTRPPTQTFLTAVLSMLAEFKDLPKYQFERRVDAFLAAFLPEILSRHLGGEVCLVAPEMPIKKPDDNQSTNIDYLMFRRADRTIDERFIFFELKTDALSLSKTQLDIYQRARERGMPALLRDLQSIRKRTKAGAKYDALAVRLAQFPADRPIEIVVLAPIAVNHPSVHSLTFRDLAAIELTGHAAEWRLFRDLVIRPVLKG